MNKSIYTSLRHLTSLKIIINKDLAAPGGRTSVKVDFVEGRTYTIFCTLPGHRASGMEVTITVGSPDSQMNTVPTTLPARATGR